MAVFALLGIALGVASVLTKIPSITTQRAFASDFTQDYLAAGALSDGLDPYLPTDTLVRREFGHSAPNFEERSQPVPHPPILIALYVPLAQLGFRVARLIWLFGSASVVVIAVAVVLRRWGVGVRFAIAGGVAMLALPVVQKELLYGQTNALLLGLIVGGWVASRSGHPILAGLSLGAAGALKLFPLFLVVPLLAMGRRQEAGWMIGVALLLSGLGAWIVGWGRAWDFAFDISPSNAEFWVAAPMNLSLVGVARRWFTPSVWVGWIDTPVVAWVIMGLVVLIAIVAVVWIARRLGTADAVLHAAPWLLLVSPLAWEFSLVLVVPLMIGVVASFVSQGTPPSVTWMGVIAIAALGVPPGLPPPEQAGVAAQLFGYGLPTVGLVLMGVLTISHSATVTSPTAKIRVVDGTGS